MAFDRVDKKRLNRAAESLPPHTWFGVSAIFHYLGPAFAVLLFPVVGVLGVAWFRIATAAVFFAPLTKPWKTIYLANNRTRIQLFLLGACLAVMNTSFYLALDRLDMSLVAAMEFVGTVGVAAWGLRNRRNWAALTLTILGVIVLIDVKWSTDPAGIAWSALNSVMFVGYIIFGHRISEGGASAGVERLGAAMAIAFVLMMPVGLIEASKAFGMPLIILAGIGVGICSSVIPYACDQLAMSRLPRATFALLLALLPASATIIAALVLSQIPSFQDSVGIALVMAGIAIHRPPAATSD